MAHFSGYGSALFLVAMMLITVADVLLRALFNLPITGAYDLVQLFLVGTVFLSIPAVFLDDENIVVDFIDHVLGPFAIACLRTAASVTGLTFVAVLSWKMLAPALDALQFKEVSPDLSIPMIVHWVLMIIGIWLALPVAALQVIDSVRHFAFARDAQ